MNYQLKYRKKKKTLKDLNTAKRFLKEMIQRKVHNEQEGWIEKPMVYEQLKQEVVERKRKEQTLRKSLMQIGRAKRECESTVDSIPQLICLIDDRGYILRTNRAVERWNLEQVVNVKGKRIHELFHPDCTDSACYLETFWALAWEELKYGRSAECEVKDRVLERHLHVQVRPISPKIFKRGEHIASFAVVIVYDITERKQVEKEIMALEEQLYKSQKMEAIGRLAGSISHYFNNLLTPITGYSQLAINSISPNDPLYQDLQKIKMAAENAIAFIRQLAALSRRHPLNPQIVNLNNLLFNMDGKLHDLVGEDIELVTLLAPDLGLVKVDPDQFEQSLVNLIINACEAMPHGGKLILETSNITLTQDYAYQHTEMTPGKYILVAVSDTGTGMTKEDKAHLFEPFYTTKDTDGGAGFGLSTTYAVVKQSGGYILVYSEKDLGTTFKIYLPRTEGEPDTLPQRDMVGPPPKGNETVLLVEDEPLVRGLAARVLREQGYNILEAANGGDAIRVARKHAEEGIHLLLTDVVMPGMNGRELAENLSPLLPQMKVLYMSGYTDSAIVHHRILEKGVNYMQKPFTVDNLARKVREVLDK